MKVHEVMTSEVRSCAPTANLAQVTQIMWESDCGLVPVVNERGEVIGIVTDRDVCIALGTRNVPASTVTASEVMSAPVHVCLPNDSVEDALSVMQAHRVRRVPVVGIGGVLLGLLSMNDVVRTAAGPEREALMAMLRAVCAHQEAPAHLALEVAG